MNQDIIQVDATPISLVESQTRAEFDIQIATARKFPRNIEKAKSNAMTMANSSPSVAAKMFFNLPRYDNDSGKNKSIPGPSIRLAELCMSLWGNIRTSSYIVEINDTEVVAEGIAHDLESNAAVKAQARCSILTKYNKRYGEKMITTTAAATCSKAVRNAIFRLIPEAFWGPVYEACMDTAAKEGASLADRRATMVAKFSEIGVAKDQIIEFLDKRSMDEVSQDDIKELIGVFKSIESGEAVTEDFFKPKGAASEKDVAEFWEAASKQGWRDQITEKEEKDVEANKISKTYLDEIRITCLKRMSVKNADAEENAKLEKAADKKKTASPTSEKTNPADEPSVNDMMQSGDEDKDPTKF